MKFLIFHDLKTLASAFGYQTSMKMAHLLNVNVACMGIGNNIFQFDKHLKTADFDFKLLYLLKDATLSDDHKRCISEAERIYKSYKKTKNKSSKQIVAFQVVKRNVETVFDITVDIQSKHLNRILDLDTLRQLIDGKDSYFYKINYADLENKDDTLIPVTDILQMMLPDPEKGQPIFFLNVEDTNYNVIPELEVHTPDSENAQQFDCIYGEKGFIFPLLTSLTANETSLARKQLTEPTKEFREQLQLWTEICYANPYTNKGLDFFRENLQPLLKSLEQEAMKSSILKNTSDFTNRNHQTQIIVGEAPIEKIWSIYRELNTITEETYNELLKIKTEQSPKFDGRWPIVFLKSLSNHTDSPAITETDLVQSVRKVIAVD